MSQFLKSKEMDLYNGNEQRLAENEKELEEMEKAFADQQAANDPEKQTEEKSADNQGEASADFEKAYEEVEIRAHDSKAQRANTAWAQKRFNEAQKAKEELAEARKKIAEMERSQSEAMIPRNLEATQEWADNNPESAAQIESRVLQNNLITNDQIQALRDEIDSLKSEKNEEIEARKADNAYNELVRRVPDAGELLADAEFNAWLDARPAMAEVVNNSLDPESAASIMNTYKYDKISKNPEALKETLQQKDIEAAADSVKTGNTSPEEKTEKKTWKASEVRAMKVNEYMKYEAEIDEAMSEGRFIDD